MGVGHYENFPVASWLMPARLRPARALVFPSLAEGFGLPVLEAMASGAPVVMRAAAAEADLGDLPWKLLGVHSARLEMGGGDMRAEESLGLNCAWYADILLTLTDEAPDGA